MPHNQHSFVALKTSSVEWQMTLEGMRGYPEGSNVPQPEAAEKFAVETRRAPSSNTGELWGAQKVASYQGIALAIP